MNLLTYFQFFEGAFAEIFLLKRKYLCSIELLLEIKIYPFDQVDIEKEEAKRL